MKALNRKGFTLAELLIVMAIVVVLAAIAVPTFGKQLETARETSDAETIRIAVENMYNEAMLAYANGTEAYDSAIKDTEVITLTQKVNNFNHFTPTIDIGGVSCTVNTATVVGDSKTTTLVVWFIKDSNGGIKLSKEGQDKAVALMTSDDADDASAPS